MCNFFPNRCGHNEKVRCSDSRDGTIQECQSSVVVPNPICGHDIQILCHQVQDVRDFEPWPFGADYTDYIVKVIATGLIYFLQPENVWLNLEPRN